MDDFAAPPSLQDSQAAAPARPRPEAAAADRDPAVPGRPPCQPMLRVRQSAGYTTDDGQLVQPHDLFMVDCACGRREHRSAAYYAGLERAWNSYKRRVGRR